jgi:Family of unknown function (DUF6161)
MPTTKMPPVYTLKFAQTKNQVVLATLESVAQWYSTEREYWSWLDSSEIQQHIRMREFSAGWLGYLNRGRSQVDEINANPKHPNYETIRNNLNSSTESLIPWYLPSNSPEAAYVVSIAKGPDGPLTAASALLTLSHWHSPQDNGSTTRDNRVAEGVVLARLFQDGVSPSSNAAVKESLEKTIGELSGRSAAIKSEHDKFTLELERWSKEYKSIASRDLEAGNAERTKTIEQLSVEFSAIKTDLELVRKTYEEHMALEGPVKYWTDRSDTHNDRFRFFVVATAIAAFSSVIFVGIVYWWVGNQISGNITTDHVLYAAVALLASTAALWLVRVVLKILLSERHLRNYAEEKAMMIKTYLAMTKIGEATKEDRQLVLASIFNTSADGIVKDDGVPDISLAAILSKQFTK